MGYASLAACLHDLEKHGELIRITEEVDPYLEMAAIHLQVHAAKGPAILFEHVKGSRYPCASNIFGTLSRSEFIFRDSLTAVRRLIDVKNNPIKAFKKPWQHIQTAWSAVHALPLQNPLQKPVMFEQIQISDLPQIHHWKQDGGAFVTLPQVYTEDPEKPGIMQANLGMYRIQLSGNSYVSNKEIGLHYQLHRGIGIHQHQAKKMGKPLRVSCFIGGPPSHTVSAVMPLPEGMSEMTFAGVLGNRRFRYTYHEGYCLSTDADFVICGEVYPDEVKPEGPFGDHLGYYSLQHPFPVMRVHSVWARKGAIWPFTVVGRPPQEDTSFGQLIHALTGNAIRYELPGVKEVHAVDAAGVHPLLLAIGSERYTPYMQHQRPAELLTIANRILGTGQLSLAKFLWITAADNDEIHTHDVGAFFQFMLARMDFTRDIHFYTQTSIDTLDYSGDGLNTGSKVVFAAYGNPIRQLGKDIPSTLHHLNAHLVMPGVLSISIQPFSDYNTANADFDLLEKDLSGMDLSAIAMIVVCDDPSFTAASIANFVWVTFTRCNPSHDIYGVQQFTEHKHWGCRGPIIIDARIKPHHAPVLQVEDAVASRAAQIVSKYL